MADVLMNYEGLQQASSQVKRHKENFDEMITGLTTIVNNLDGQWEGFAKQEFEKAFEELKPTLRKFSELLGQYGIELDTEVERQRNTIDGSVKRISGNLSFQ